MHDRFKLRLCTCSHLLNDGISSPERHTFVHKRFGRCMNRTADVGSISLGSTNEVVCPTFYPTIFLRKNEPARAAQKRCEIDTRSLPCAFMTSARRCWPRRS